MHSSRLPTELCEAIIDAVRPACDNWFNYPEESHTLLSCALVCRAWRARAQLNIWKAVLIQHRERIPMFGAAVRSSPERLAPLVRTMCVHPFGEKVQLEFFMPTLPNLRLLIVEGVTLETLHPRAFRMRMPLLAGLTELRLSECTFHTVKDLLDIVWSCGNLSRLVVLKPSFARARFTEEDSLRLSSLPRRSGACEKLTSLKIYGHPFDNRYAPAGNVFGSAITEFDIVYSDLCASSTLPRILASFTSLQTLSVTGFLLDAADWKDGSALILSLAEALPNPGALRTMRLHIEGSYETDIRTIDALCGPEVVGEKNTPSLRARLFRLVRLEVRLAGISARRQLWWADGISRRIPCVRDVLAVKVAAVKEVGLWT